MRRSAAIAAMSVDERFWSKVKKDSECWLWTASVFYTGRGQFRFDGRNQQAHRVAWELTHGSPPAGLLRSKCGNLRCVRPDHQIVTDRKVGARNLARTPVKRFNAMVRRGPGCWEWSGSAVDGYGQFSVQVPGTGRQIVPAHRFAWESMFGTIPEGADVLHVCRNRRCVRPDHLVLWNPAIALRLPTRRQLQILRVWVHLGMKWKSHAQIATELGVRPHTVASQLYQLRSRLGVTGTREAVEWLDVHDATWRD